jgi:hypothetical protein
VLGRDDERMSESSIDAFAALCGGTPPNRPRPVPPARPVGEPGEDGEPGEPTAEQLAEHERKLAEYAEALDRWYDDWIGGTPTRAQLQRLPFRVQRHLFGWLSGKINDPESGPAATKPSLEVVRSA